MNREEKKVLQELVGKNEIEEFVEYISEYIEEKWDERKLNKEDYYRLSNDLLNLGARYNRLKQENYNGILKYEDYNVERNKINQSAIQIIDTIPNSLGEKSQIDSFTDLRFRKRIIRKVKSWKNQSNLDYDFYLCYSTKDSSTANKIYENLTSVGFTVFKSEFIELVSFGATFRENIKYVLKNSQAFILFGSEQTIITDDRVKMDYEFYFKAYHTTNPTNRLFFIYQTEDFPTELIPSLLKNTKTSNSLVEIANEFLLIKKENIEENKISEIEKYLNRKDNEYKNLIADKIPPKNIMECPNCSFPIEKPSPEGWIATLLCFIPFGVSFYYFHQDLGIILAFVMGIIGIFLVYMVASLIQLIVNKWVVEKERECSNCHYLLKPKDNQERYEKEEVEITKSKGKEGNKDYSTNKELRVIKKSLEKNKIKSGLERLIKLFLKERDTLSVKKTKQLIGEYLDNLEDKNNGVISHEDYNRRENQVIKNSFKLLKEYEQYLILLRKYANRNKSFDSNYLKLYSILEQDNCEKHIRTFIEHGHNFDNFWIIDEDDLISMESIPTGDRKRIELAIMKEKRIVIWKALQAIVFILSLGGLFYFFSQLDYYDFNWDNGINSLNLSDLKSLNIKDFYLEQLFLLVAPIIDKLVAIGSIIFGAIILIWVIFPRLLTKSGPIANLAMISLYMTFVPIMIVIFYSFFLYLASFPISYNYYSEISGVVEKNYFNYYFDVFKLGFFIRLIPYGLMVWLFPKVFSNITENHY